MGPQNPNIRHLQKSLRPVFFARRSAFCSTKLARPVHRATILYHGALEGFLRLQEVQNNGTVRMTMGFTSIKSYQQEERAIAPTNYCTTSPPTYWSQNRTANSQHPPISDPTDFCYSCSCQTTTIQRKEHVADLPRLPRHNFLSRQIDKSVQRWLQVKWLQNDL